MKKIKTTSYIAGKLAANYIIATQERENIHDDKRGSSGIWSLISGHLPGGSISRSELAACESQGK